MILKHVGKINYVDNAKMIIYNGKMSEDEKVSLLNSLTSEQHKKAVNSLYMQSNADPKLMTLACDVRYYLPPYPIPGEEKK